MYFVLGMCWDQDKEWDSFVQATVYTFRNLVHIHKIQEATHTLQIRSKKKIVWSENKIEIEVENTKQINN